MRLLVLALLALAVPAAAHDSSCPTRLHTQADVDAFDCTSISRLTTAQNSDTSNLDSLHELEVIDEDLRILSVNGLTSLAGLGGLTRGGRHLVLKDNPQLAHLDALSQLAQIGGYLEIRNNDALITLSGLDGLTAVPRTVTIEGSYGLTSLAGLEGLTSIGRGLSIRGNASLQTLDGLANLSSIGRGLTPSRPTQT